MLKHVQHWTMEIRIGAVNDGLAQMRIVTHVGAQSRQAEAQGGQAEAKGQTIRRPVMATDYKKIGNTKFLYQPKETQEAVSNLEMSLDSRASNRAPESPSAKASGDRHDQIGDT